MQRLLDLMGTPDIKIITGVRRSGKSELMKAYIRRIREMQPEANIIFVDFFDLKNEGLMLTLQASSTKCSTRP